MVDSVWILDLIRGWMLMCILELLLDGFWVYSGWILGVDFVVDSGWIRWWIL